MPAERPAYTHTARRVEYQKSFSDAFQNAIKETWDQTQNPEQTFAACANYLDFQRAFTPREDIIQGIELVPMLAEFAAQSSKKDLKPMVFGSIDLFQRYNPNPNCSAHALVHFASGLVAKGLIYPGQEIAVAISESEEAKDPLIAEIIDDIFDKPPEEPSDKGWKSWVVLAKKPKWGLDRLN